MSAAEQNLDHAGEQYTSLAATVARKTSYSEVADMPVSSRFAETRFAEIRV